MRIIRVAAGRKGYLLTGRNGFFSSYEAFVHVVDVEIPMTKQAVGNGFAYWKGSQAVRSYANPGTVIQPFGLRTTGAVTLGYCTVTMIGHYVQAQ